MIGSCIKHIPIAGRDITSFIQALLRDREPQIPPEQSMETAKQIKVNILFCPVLFTANFRWKVWLYRLSEPLFNIIDFFDQSQFCHRTGREGKLKKVFWVHVLKKSEFQFWFELENSLWPIMYCFFQEMYCYVCPDIAVEFAKYDKEMDKWIKVYEGHNSVTKAPFKVDVGYEKFLGPEIFFHPEVCGDMIEESGMMG